MKSKSYFYMSLLGLALVACGDSSLPTPPDDMTVLHDLTVLPTDLASASDMPFPLGCSPTTGVRAKMVANTFILPNNGNVQTRFPFDLNGDGKPDNQLAALITALASAGSAGPNPQQSVTDSVNSGQLVLLFDETAAAFDNDTCPHVALQQGSFPGYPGTAPKLDGTDTFAAGSGNSTFVGTNVASVFTSESPVTTTQPVSVTLNVYLSAGVPVTLPIIGARITFKKTPTGAINGVLNGAIKYSDVKTTIMPAVAQILTNQVQLDPPGMPGTVANIFDTGTGCTASDHNLDGSPAAAGDQKIAVCEVVNNSLIKSVVLPDVQLFAANGTTWAPNPANTKKDSMSLGFGFTLVGANF